jgi:hypothetical protein
MEQLGSTMGQIGAGSVNSGKLSSMNTDLGVSSLGPQSTHSAVLRTLPCTVRPRLPRVRKQGF